MDKEQVLAMSRHAYETGVRTGMRVGGVATISPETIMLDRDVLKEQQAINAVATALMQYTPEVALLDDASVVMDVTASLRLFGGHLRICQLIRSSIERLGFTAYVGAAPTSGGAWLLAHAARMRNRPLVRRCIRLSTLHRHLELLACHVLPAATPYLDWLRGLGALNLGAIRRLPRPGLLRRTNKQLINALDRAFGDEHELFEWIVPSPTFNAHAETFDRIEQADALMIGATGLVLQMTGWLTVQQLAVTTFTLSLEHERGRAAVAPTFITISLAEPAWREPHLLRLLKERLSKVELTSPVIGLRLEAKQLQSMRPTTDQLFPEPGGTPEDFNRLMELLSARLGDVNVMKPLPTSDHLPEDGNRWVPAVSKQKKERDLGETLERPAWILPIPMELRIQNHRPFYAGSTLKIVEGPERIEARWWDGQLSARDYFVAEGSDSTMYWIYLERKIEARWFLHGLYA